jgi:hypothetical protein
VFPIGAGAIAFAACAAAVVVLAWRRGASLAPCALLLLVLMPWLPRAPAVFLIWTGALGAVVLAGAGLLMIAPALRVTWTPAILGRPVVAAGVLAAAVYSVAAWQVASQRPGGDEPHYLIITQSLLLDRDLKIENNHRRGDYRAYFAGDLRPDARRRGRDGEIYSIHAPGVPALVAPAFALAGYRGVVVFLIVLSSIASALAWHLASRVTGDAGAAWFGWSAVTLSATSVFQSFAVFPDGPGALLVLTGLWAIARAKDEAVNPSERAVPWLLHGAALALLPWMHARLAITAGSLGGLILLRLAHTRNAAGKAVAFLAVPAVSALAWLAFFIAIYGTPDPTAPFGNEPRSIAFVPGGIVGLLFDQRFGLLAYAPVLACAIGGLAVMLTERERRRDALEILFLIAPYVLTITHVAMWWGGASAPARFLAPLVPALAIPAAVAWRTITSRTARATALITLALSVFATGVLVFVDGGRLAYNRREAYAYWLEWLSRTADLAHGLPSFWRDNGAYAAWGSIEMAALLRDVSIWAIVLIAAWAALRRLERQRFLQGTSAFATMAVGVYALGAMVAMAAVWRFNAVDGIVRTAGQLQVLRRISGESTLVAATLDPAQRVAVSGVAERLRLEPAPATEPGAAGRNDRPLYALAGVPAGRYRLRVRSAGDGGWLMVGIGADQFALRTGPIGSPPEPILLDFPVNVRAIVVKGDEQARRAIRGLTIEPLSVVAPEARLTPATATRAIRYGSLNAYFLDDGSFGEPDAFWVGGGRQTSLVLQPDTPAALPILIRNAPVANVVSLSAGSWHESLTLAPREERTIQVPIDPSRAAALLTVSTTAGFRPSETDTNSRDHRFLGVWVKPFPDAQNLTAPPK